MVTGRNTELNHIDIKVTSPGRFVQVHLTRRERARVKFNTEVRQFFDENTAPEEVEYAVSEAWLEYATRAEQIRQKWSEQRVPISMEKNCLPGWQDDLNKELSDIEVNSQSSNGLVTATAYGDGDLVVHFLDNCIRRTDISVDLLGMETTQAIDEAKCGQASITKEIYQKYWTQIKNDWPNRSLPPQGSIMSHTYETWRDMIKQLAEEVMDKALEVREKTWHSQYKEGPEDLYLIADIDPIILGVDILIDNWPWPYDMDPIIETLAKVAPPIPASEQGVFDASYLTGGTLQGDAFTDIPSAVRALNGWESPSMDGKISASDLFKDKFLTPIPDTAEDHTVLVSQLSTFAQGYRDLYLAAYRDLEYTLREAIKRLEELLKAAEAASIAENYAIAAFTIGALAGGGIPNLFTYVIGAVGRADARTDIGGWVDVIQWVNDRLTSIPEDLEKKESEVIENMNTVADYVRSSRKDLVFPAPNTDGFTPTSIA